MTTTATLTKKWQIHIPKKIRQKVGLTQPGQVKVSVEQKKIILEPQPSIMELKGKYKVNKPIDIGKLRDEFEKSMALDALS